MYFSSCFLFGSQLIPLQQRQQNHQDITVAYVLLEVHAEVLRCVGGM